VLYVVYSAACSHESVIPAHCGLIEFGIGVWRMSTVKESLYNSIERLSDEEALQTLEFIQRLRQNKKHSKTLKRLASDPVFSVPPEDLGGFRSVEPLPGKGIPASRLLVEDRR
jgi:hypothetical protein